MVSWWSCVVVVLLLHSAGAQPAGAPSSCQPARVRVDPRCRAPPSNLTAEQQLPRGGQQLPRGGQQLPRGGRRCSVFLCSLCLQRSGPQRLRCHNLLAHGGEVCLGQNDSESTTESMDKPTESTMEYIESTADSTKSIESTESPAKSTESDKSTIESDKSTIEANKFTIESIESPAKSPAKSTESDKSPTESTEFPAKSIESDKSTIESDKSTTKSIESPAKSTNKSTEPTAAVPPFSCPPPLQAPAGLNFRFLGAEDCGAPCGAGVLPLGPAEVRLCRRWVAFWAVLCCGSTLFTVLTFLLDPPRFRYPERPIVFLSGCDFVVAACYLAGFLLEDAAACVGKFGAHGHKMAAQGAAADGCSGLFAVLYFFSMAASGWWPLLCLAWFLSAGRKWSPEAVRAHAPYLHVAAWAAPAAQTAAALFAGRAEGDPLTGVCFVGASSRGVFLLAPLSLHLLLGAALLLAGFAALCRVRAEVRARSRGGAAAAARLRRFMLRLGGFALLHALPAAAAVACLLSEHALRPRWELAWRRRTCLRLGVECPPPAEAPPRGRALLLVLLKYLMTLVGGITSGAWVWSEKTLRSWRKFYKRLRHGKSKETTV